MPARSAAHAALLFCVRQAERGELEPTIVYTLTKREAADIAVELGVRFGLGCWRWQVELGVRGACGWWGWQADLGVRGGCV